MKIEFTINSTNVGLPFAYANEMILIEEPLVRFFEPKEYGKGCQTIIYSQHCVNTEIFDNFVDGSHYEPRKKRIVCSVELDYKTSLALTYRLEFAKYIKNRFLDKAMDFYELDVPDFDLDSFVADVERFFEEYLARHTGSNQPLWPDEEDAN